MSVLRATLHDMDFQQPHYGDTLTDMNRVVVDNIANHPRSLQKTIGPSEMGCDRCITRHFAGIEKMPETQFDPTKSLDEQLSMMPWLPAIGTAWHTQLEEWFTKKNEELFAETGFQRYLLEDRVPVGIIGNRYIDGSCDLFDLWTATVVDHKLVGTTKLKKVRSKGHPGLIYRKQAHIYGRGWKLRGYDVDRVAVRFYPRNDISMAAGIYWSEPWDADFAEDAVTNVQRLATAAHALAATPDALNQFLLSLSGDPDCFSCDEYPPLEGDSTPDKHELVRSDLFHQPAPPQRRY